MKENGKLEMAYQQISNFPVKSIGNKEEKLAFYINAYNILALKTVVDHWPLDSISAGYSEERYTSFVSTSHCTNSFGS